MSVIVTQQREANEEPGGAGAAVRALLWPRARRHLAHGEAGAARARAPGGAVHCARVDGARVEEAEGRCPGGGVSTARARGV